MWHRNRKTRWKSHISPIIQPITAISGTIYVWKRENRRFRMLLAKPVWKPRGHEESEDLTDFHLNAFRVFFEVFRKNTWVFGAA